MIIWSGAGIVIGLLGFACVLLTQYAVNGAMGENIYYQTHGWPKLVGLWTAAILSWPIGWAMNRTEERKLVDPESGTPVVVHSGGGHSLFFVPVQHWWAVFLVLGIVFAFVSRPPAEPLAEPDVGPKAVQRR